MSLFNVKPRSKFGAETLIHEINPANTNVKNKLLTRIYSQRSNLLKIFNKNTNIYEYKMRSNTRRERRKCIHFRLSRKHNFPSGVTVSGFASLNLFKSQKPAVKIACRRRKRKYPVGGNSQLHRFGAKLGENPK